jgi:hypothetical protein
LYIFAYEKRIRKKKRESSQVETSVAKAASFIFINVSRAHAQRYIINFVFISCNILQCVFACDHESPSCSKILQPGRRSARALAHNVNRAESDAEWPIAIFQTYLLAHFDKL